MKFYYFRKILIVYIYKYMIVCQIASIWKFKMDSDMFTQPLHHTFIQVDMNIHI
jgi:hypothetical protein